MIWIFSLILAERIGIFDAGSTGTRLNIYEFENGRIVKYENYRSEKQPFEIFEKNCFSAKNNPIRRKIDFQKESEINSKDDKKTLCEKEELFYANYGLDNLSECEIKNVLRFLLAKGAINQKNLLGFYATAGFRQAKNAEKQLEIVKNLLKNFNLKEIKILSGREEALSLLKGFEYLMPGIDNFHLIDMGGKSTQTILKENNIIKVSSENYGSLETEKSDYEEKYNKKFLKYKNKNFSNKLKTRNQGCENRDESKDSNKMTFLFSFYKSLFKDFNKENNSEKIKTTSFENLLSKFDDFCRIETGNNKSSGETKCKNYLLGISFLESLGIEPKARIAIVDEVKGVQVSWALGAALKLLDKIF